MEHHADMPEHTAEPHFQNPRSQIRSKPRNVVDGESNVASQSSQSCRCTRMEKTDDVSLLIVEVR